MPTTKQIPRDEWRRYFEIFSARHRSGLVTLRVLDADLGCQVEARDQALKDVSVEHTPKGETILMLLGDSERTPLVKCVEDPEAVLVKTADADGDEVIEIVARSGPRLLLSFRSPALLEARH